MAALPGVPGVVYKIQYGNLVDGVLEGGADSRAMAVELSDTVGIEEITDMMHEAMHEMNVPDYLVLTTAEAVKRDEAAKASAAAAKVDETAASEAEAITKAEAAKSETARADAAKARDEKAKAQKEAAKDPASAAIAAAKRMSDASRYERATLQFAVAEAKAAAAAKPATGTPPAPPAAKPAAAPAKP